MAIISIATMLFLLLVAITVNSVNAFTPMSCHDSSPVNVRGNNAHYPSNGNLPSKKLWSTTEDQEETTVTNVTQSTNNIQESKQSMAGSQTFFAFAKPKHMANYEVVDPSREWNDESNIKLKKEDFVITNDEDLQSDEIMNLLRSEIGVKEILLKKSDLTSPLSDVVDPTVPDSSRLPLDVLLQRTMDTFEDIAVHLRRIPFANGKQQLSKEEAESRKTIVCLGSGWAAHALMKVIDCRKIRLIIVSPVNHFVFTPMLASASVGTVEYRSMTEAVRASNPCMENYFEGKAIGVDIENRIVTVKLNNLLDGLREGESPQIDLKYDSLVVSVGCTVDGRGVPGVEKALRLKTLDDARKLRQALCETFEFASRPDVAGPEKTNERIQRATIAICGGGPTGVELAGELRDLADDITRKYKGSYSNLENNIRVVLVHGGSELVPQFDKNLRKEALKTLTKQGIEVLLNTRVIEVMNGKIKLSQIVFDSEGDEQGREEFDLPVGLSVWAAGTKPVEFTEKLLAQLPETARNLDGRVKVDKWMRPPMPKDELVGSIFVLGDAAAFPERSEDIAQASTLPQTAQVAGQQGAYLARLLNRGYNLDSTPPALPDVSDVNRKSVFNDPITRKWLELRGIVEAEGFVFLNLGLLAYLGGGEALTQIQLGDVPVFSYFGSIAFVLWRSVYLVKQVATRNRILVTFDWLKSALFERDLTRF